MPTRHHTSSTSIRSFTSLLDKLRARLHSGASSGAAAALHGSRRLVAASCYFAPTRGMVVLELAACADVAADVAADVPADAGAADVAADVPSDVAADEADAGAADVAAGEELSDV